MGYVRLREIDEAGVISLEAFLVGFEQFLRLYRAGIVKKKGTWYIIDRREEK